MPFAKGALAVMLFEGEQQNWSGIARVREISFRCVKILNAAGIESESD